MDVSTRDELLARLDGLEARQEVIDRKAADLDRDLSELLRRIDAGAVIR